MNGKKRKKIICLLFIMGEVTLKNATHLVYFSQSLNYFDLSETKVIEGFHPRGIFPRKLYIVRY